MKLIWELLFGDFVKNPLSLSYSIKFQALNMKYFILLCIALFSIETQAQSESIINNLSLQKDEIFIFVKHEQVLYVKIANKSNTGGGPVYECFCKTGGDCELKWASKDMISCDAAQSSPTDFNGCGWRKAGSKLPNEVFGYLTAAEQVFKAYKPKELAAGITLVSPWQIELAPEVTYEYVKNADGKTSIQFRRQGAVYGPSVQCNCSCEQGTCTTTGTGSVLICSGDCKMQPDGNPCEGCGFGVVKGK